MSLVNLVESRFTPGAPPLLPFRTIYPDGYAIEPHQHRRHQLLYGSSGVVMVATPGGRWVMPPERGMWIPAGIVHDVRTIGTVRMHSLYFDRETIDGMPGHCQVLGIPPFMRALIAEAMELPDRYEAGERNGALVTLIRFELTRLPQLPLSLPMPDHPGLAALCHRFLGEPDAHAGIAGWSAALGISRRSFTRLFRQKTGMSFADWRQQACVVAALPRLAAGEAVTQVAGDFGYDNPAAFAAMFRRILGAPPRSYQGCARPGTAAPSSLHHPATGA